MSSSSSSSSPSCGNRVLSIQSHVVSGYVGNKAATFPLQLLGFDVDPINTVHFSNHTGYAKFGGGRMQPEELGKIIAAMEENGLLNQSYLLTGYVGNLENLKCIADVAAKLRESNPNLVYLCDPVLGDNGKLYVPLELVSLYRDRLLPLASIITPNQFEAEQLSEMKLTNESDCIACLDALIAKGVGIVVITSVFTGEHISVYLGYKTPTGNKHVRFEVDVLDCPDSGTGDLLSALLLAMHARYPTDPLTAVQYAIGTIQAVLRRTLQVCAGMADKKRRELALIQSKDEIANPTNAGVRVFPLD